MSDMRLNTQTGSINVAVLALVVVTLFLIGASVFGYWAYQGRQEYKNNSDQKVSAAVENAKQATVAADTAKFVEANKSPLRTYTGPSAYGSVSIQYPKSWSAYVADDSGSDPYVNGYFYPGVVPNVSKEKATFALRIQVVQQSYNTVISDYQSLVDQGKVKVSAYKAAKVPGIVGSRLDGQVEPERTGSMIVLPLRDKTLKIWTNTTQFQPDFETYILPNFSFAP